MAMQLDTVVPFGRSLDEYRQMFALSEDDLARNIIGVGDGPASFNAEMHALGKRVVSIDPLFRFSADDIEWRFYAVVDDIIAQVTATPDDWGLVLSPFARTPASTPDQRVNPIYCGLRSWETSRAVSRR